MATHFAQIIHMGRVGGYAVRLDGVLLEVNGRMLWSSAEALRTDVARLGVEISDSVIDTRPVIAPPMELRWAA